MDILKKELSLDTRSGLPDALRVLVEQYPRDIWESHDNFDGLVRFWLERHVMFRKLLDMIRHDLEEREAQILSPDQHKGRLARFGNIFVGDLHMHHNIEDHQYFPALTRLENSLAGGFEILDHDHHAIDDHLRGFTEDANAILQAASEKDTENIDRFHRQVEQMHGFLDRHLTDEEELVVPIVLKHGFQG